MTKEEKKAIEYLKDYIKSDLNYFTIDFNNNLRISMNLIEKLQKENEELKNKVVKRDKELIKLEEYANKNFERKDDVKANYISKDKIREKIKELEEYIVKIEEETCGRCITIGEDMCIRYLKELLEEGKKLIDLMHCEIVYYYVCENDGYYWDGFVVIKCDDKYCVVEYKGSQSGWIKNQLESVDKEFLDNVIGDRKLDNIDDDFPSYFNTFLETTYNYPIPDAIMQQLKDQDAILLDFEDIKKHIKEERNAR